MKRYHSYAISPITRYALSAHTFNRISSYRGGTRL